VPGVRAWITTLMVMEPRVGGKRLVAHRDGLQVIEDAEVRTHHEGHGNFEKRLPWKLRASPGPASIWPKPKGCAGRSGLREAVACR
jgi:hypothetical protein